MLKKGKKYKYNYPNLIYYNKDKGQKVYSFRINIILPKDYDYLYPDDPVILSYGLSDEEESNFRILKYHDLPTSKGKLKWTLEKELDNTILISNLPHAVDCSLNTYDHPSKRKWFQHYHMGISMLEYENINWKRWKNFPIIFNDNEVTLFYRLICEIVRFENLDIEDYDTLKEKVSNCFLDNYPYKFGLDLLEEYHENYLRDLLQIW